jgi:hypothetical protein
LNLNIPHISIFEPIFQIIVYCFSPLLLYLGGFELKVPYFAVASPPEAWIETDDSFDWYSPIDVASPPEAWIETKDTVGRPLAPNVASPPEAWIETRW